ELGDHLLSHVLRVGWAADHLPAPAQNEGKVACDKLVPRFLVTPVLDAPEQGLAGTGAARAAHLPASKGRVTADQELPLWFHNAVRNRGTAKKTEKCVVVRENRAC